MRNVNTGLTVALCLAVMTVVASAQGPSYESRGYGGPLYIGPNFEQGGQSAPPVYGEGPSEPQDAATQRSYNEKHESPATREASGEAEARAEGRRDR